MGTLESKLAHHLMTDELGEALQLWQANEELQSKININGSLRGALHKDPPLHCVLRHGNYRSAEMRTIVQIFLDKGANPLTKNGLQETALHILCCSQRQGARENKARCTILEMLLQKLPDDKTGIEQSLRRPAKMGGSRCVTSSLSLQDSSRNTPLHLASASGLLDCIELLLAYGAPLFVTNIAKKTPLESAVDAKQMIIAQFLESQMVMTDVKKSPESETESLPSHRDKTKSFYTPEQLKVMRDDLVKEISETLQILPDAARAILSAYSWSRELVVSAWKEDNSKVCAKAGLDITEIHTPNERFISLSPKSCQICFEPIPIEDLVDVPCGHYFCRDCWTSYLEVSVAEGGGKDIHCPGHDCSRPVPIDVIAKLVSEELFRKYSELNIQHFVDSNKDFKWCPYPDCKQAVMKKDGRTSDPELGQRHGINVECGNGHGFCWNCTKHAHEPCECEVWETWIKEVSRMALVGQVDMTEIAAQAEADAQWIINNTKPCPSCNSPIQKNEGCNHMTCRKCYHDFCWVCLDPWSEHSYRTGGYFSCNRYLAQRRASGRVQDVRNNMARKYREDATVEVQRQVEKFTHYHDRYVNHLHGIQIECQILAMSQAKTRSLMSMRKVVERKVASKRGNTIQNATKDINPEETENFLEGVVRVLLQARRLLATSYGIGYLIPDDKKEARDAHDTLQGKLEEVVESLAQMVNRPYLNTPRTEMASRARDVSFICQEFTEVMRDVVLTGLKEEPPPEPNPLPSPPDENEDDVLEVDPLVLFAHLAMRMDPEFREVFNRLMTEQQQQQQHT